MLMPAELLLAVSLFSSFTHSFLIPERRAEWSPTAKAGLGWPNADSANISQFITNKVSWYYSWSPWLPTHNQTDIEFVPMLWGPPQLADFQNNIAGLINATGPTHILGMNEPEQGAQSNLTPDQGAAFWKMYLEPLRANNSNIHLGSPATSSAPTGKTWLQSFLTSCAGGCNVDFVALHWYGTNASQFIDYIEDFHNTFQKPIWVTEWNCQNYVDLAAQCSPQQITDFMTISQSYMDSTDWVERYSWFGAMKNLGGVMNPANALMDPNGIITDLGLKYTGQFAQGSASNSTNHDPTTTGSPGNPTAAPIGVNQAVRHLPATWPLLLLACTILFTTFTYLDTSY